MRSLTAFAGEIGITLPLRDDNTVVTILQTRTEGLHIKMSSDSSKASIIDVACQSVQGRLVNDTGDRTLFRTLSGAPELMPIKVNLRSWVDHSTRGKRLSIDAELEALQVDINSDLDLVGGLVQLARPPPGAFVDVEQGELTAIHLTLRKVVVRLLPVTLDSAVAIHVRSLGVSTAVRPASSNVVIEITGFEAVEMWIADRPTRIQGPDILLKACDYARLASLDGFRVSLYQQSAPQESLSILVRDAHLQVTACPDTLLVLGDLLGDFPPPERKGRRPAQPTPDMSSSVLMQRPISGARLGTLDTPAAVAVPSEARRVVHSNADYQVSVIGNGPIPIAVDWLTGRQEGMPLVSAAQGQTMSISVEESSATISVFEGYDFDRTRKFVKQTVKATRRRLEKIRQLVAEGQVPEETIEEAADDLLQSVFLPSRSVLPDGSDGDNGQLDAYERIVAFDNELDEEEEAKASSQEWEELPDRPPRLRRTFSGGSPAPAVRQVGRLFRPKQSALDVRLDDLHISHKAFSGNVGLASRMQLDIGDFTIVDSITSSTWHKFLTELRPRDGGLLRPTGAPMVQVALKMLRTESSESEEADLKVRMSPLRLHVDQDALDFLKAFAAFKMDSPLSSQTDVKHVARISERSESGGFVQRVEIFPIKIKLDYKPKRVDYRALQQGRTIEAMNFFHFEASEMTLRHLVLTGVPSWAKVGDMCQDIWTPDVKSNQLADFLAGINPVRSVVNVGTGVADLVLLPVQQYQKDGRLGRGVQKGTSKFAKTTALEAVKLGARLASGTQVILEKAEHLIAPQQHPPARADGMTDLLAEAMAEDADIVVEEHDLSGRQEALSKFSSQPKNAKEGLHSAYRSLSGNVRSAAQTILAVPIEVYERSSEVSRTSHI